MGRVGSRRGRLVVAALVVGLYLASRWWGGVGEPTGSAGSAERAFAEKTSNVFVELSGQVERLLADDRQGSRHQRFIVRLASGQTVLVAHNLDLAERVPLALGDRVELRGEFEWNPRGGVVHWTHHDPQGRRAGGWIRHRGREYR